VGFTWFYHFYFEGMIIYGHQDKPFCNKQKAILLMFLRVCFGGLKNVN